MIELKPYRKEHLVALSSGDLAVLLNAFLHGAILGTLQGEAGADLDLTQTVDEVASWMRAALHNMQNVNEILDKLARGEAVNNLSAAKNMLEASVRAMVGVLWVHGDQKAAADAIVWSADNLHDLFKPRD